MSASHLNFCDGVRHLYTHGLNNVPKIADNGFRYWLATTNNFIPNENSKPNFVELTFYDDGEVLSGWAHDINRLSCATVETIINLNPDLKNKKFLAWNIVNYYYSAFYSAHSILKILGFGLVQIDSRMINNIKQKYLLYGYSEPNLSNGIYCIDFDFVRRTAVLYKVNKYSESHKGLWQRFSDLLGVLIGILIEAGSYDSICIRLRESTELNPKSIYTYLPLEDANLMIEYIENLRNTLNKNRDFNWLSTTRNIVNYSNGFGVWYPYKEYDKRYEVINNMQNLCFKNPFDKCFNMTEESDLVLYVTCCQLINALNIDIIRDLNKRHPNNSSFLKNGVIAFMKLHGAQ